MKKGNLELAFDKVPVEMIEDRFVTPLEDIQLRRTSPKRRDQREDQLAIDDSDVSNRYDNEIGLVSALERLNWEIDSFIMGKIIGKVSSINFNDEEFKKKLKDRFYIYQKVYSWNLNLEHLFTPYKKFYNTYADNRSVKLIEAVPLKIVQKYIPSIEDNSLRPFPIGYDYIYNIEIGEVVPWEVIVELLKFHKVGNSPEVQTLNITYTGFPEDVKQFIETHFEKELKRFPEIRNKLNNLFIGPLSLPEDYDVNVAAEYVPEDNFIAYYLPFELLKNNYEGIVHEICHLFQDFFETNSIDTDWKVPNKKDATYRTGGIGYRNDLGEIQANLVVEAYRKYKVGGFEDYLKRNEVLFQERFDNFEDNGGNIFWSSDYAQSKRFEALMKVFTKDVDLSKSSILDIGCGYGDLIDYLKSNNYVFGDYTGIDIVDPIIKIAQHKHPEEKFIIGDMFNPMFSENEFTYVIASGIFALEDKVWEEYVIRSLERLYKLAVKGVAVNFLKGDVTYNNLHYTNREIVGKFAKVITDNFKVVDDYLPDDLTLYLFK